MGRRLALLVATYEHDDPGLRQLTSPLADAEALASVLRDPAIAGFEVTVLVNEPHYRVGEAIASLYRDRRRDDLTLLYFTGHGLRDDDGRLYLATANTRRDSLLFTSLPAEQIDYAMENCASQQKILVLDCCYSGAFPQERVKADTDVHALERFRGRGRTILTASDSLQYSFEGEPIGGITQSIFTRHLVEGIRDGNADLDGDGNITVDELYTYVHDRVVEESPRQRPKRLDNVEGRTIIARNTSWSMPIYLRNSLKSPIASDRLSALDGLLHLHRIGNDSVRAEVIAELERLADDDSRAVSTAAAAQLAALRPARSAPAGDRLPGPQPSEAPPAADATGEPALTDRPLSAPLEQGVAPRPDPPLPGTPAEATSTPEVADEHSVEIGDMQLAAESTKVRQVGAGALPEFSCLALAATLFLVALPLDSPDIAPIHVVGWATTATATIGVVTTIIERNCSRIWVLTSFGNAALCVLYGTGLVVNNALPSPGMGIYAALAAVNALAFFGASRIPYLIGLQESEGVRPSRARLLLLMSSAAAIAFTVAFFTRRAGATGGGIDSLLLLFATGVLIKTAVVSTRGSERSSASSATAPQSLESIPKFSSAVLLLSFVQLALILTPIGRTDAGVGLGYSVIASSALGLAVVLVERRRDRMWVQVVACNLVGLLIYAALAISVLFAIGSLVLAAGWIVNSIFLVMATRRARREPRSSVRWLLPGWLAVAVLAIPIVLVSTAIAVSGGR
jgi:hypothetical protein